MSRSPQDSDIPGFDASTPALPPRPPRHALGLPAGSIRALLAFMVLGVLWLLALFANRAEGESIALTENVPVIYLYLQYVMILILAHYFASHGSSIGKTVSDKSPLGLPAGSVRFLLLAGYVGLIVWLFYNKRQFETPPQAALVLPLILMAGFFAGFLLTRLARAVAGGMPWWFQDVQAWLALLAVIGLTIITIVYLFVFPTIEQEMRFDLTTLETIVAAIVGFYFGARS
jgi:hypothetical protein